MKTLTIAAISLMVLCDSAYGQSFPGQPPQGAILIGKSGAVPQWGTVINSHPTGIDGTGLGSVLALETQAGSTYNIGLPAAMQIFAGGQSGTNLAETVPMTGLQVALIASAWNVGGGFIGAVRADARAPAGSNVSPIGFYANVSSDGTNLAAGPYGINTIAGSAGGQNGFGAYIEVDDFNGSTTQSANNVGVEINVQTKSGSFIAGLNMVHVPVSGAGAADMGTAIQVGPNWQNGVKFLQGANVWPQILFDSLNFGGLSGLWEILNTPSLTFRKILTGSRNTGVNAPIATTYNDSLNIDDASGDVFLGGDGGSTGIGGKLTMRVGKDNGPVCIWQNSCASSLDILGSLAVNKPSTQTTNYSMQTADASIIFNGGGTINLTLQNAASFPGRMLYVRTIAAQAVNSAGSNVVPLAGGAAGTGILTASAGKWAILQSDGANWQIMAAN